MLVREESQSYIEAVEPEVEAIFRSRETLELPGAGAATLPVQAFVCGIRKEEEFQVFVALHSKSMKRNLIYSVVVEKKGKSGYEVAMKCALDACKAMGLAMESVNLKFSTAMREVVIRDIPVLLSPAAAKRAATQKAEELAELERLTLQPEESEAPEEAAAGLSPARRAARERARQERQEEVKAAARKLAAESAVDEKVTAARQAVERLLAAGFEVVRCAAGTAPAAKLPGKTERRPLPPTVDGEAPMPAPMATPSRAVEQDAGDAQEMQRLARELDRLMAEKAAAEQRVAELSATARQAAERAEAERAERERLEAAKALAEERALELAEATRQAELRVEAERAEREELLAAKAAAERRALELAEAARAVELHATTSRAEQERQSVEQAERQQAEWARLEAEKAAAEQRTAELVEAVRAAERRVEVERGEREQLLAEKTRAEQRATELAEAVRFVETQASTGRTEKERLAIEQAERERTERARLETEKLAAERRATELAEAVRRAERQAAAERAKREQLLAEKAAVEQQVAELTSAARRAAEMAEIARQAAERAEAERRERERLEIEKERVERRLLEQAEVPRKGDAGTTERGRQPTTLPSLGGLFASHGSAMERPSAPPPKASSRPAVSGAFFRVDWNLADVVYDSPDDVLEVHQSISMTQLSLEGFPNQYCTAFIVASKKGKGRQVYVAFRLAASNRVLVYAPPRPPHNQETYARAMQEAGRFLRVTGIETERLPLGDSPQSRALALSQIPVLRHHPSSARNS